MHWAKFQNDEAKDFKKNNYTGGGGGEVSVGLNENFGGGLRRPGNR